MLPEVCRPAWFGVRRGPRGIRDSHGRRRAFLLAPWRALVGAVLLLCALQASAQPSPPEYKPGELIIKFRRGASAEHRQSVRSDLGARDVRPLPGIAAERLRITRGNVEQAIERYRSHPDVEFVEPNYILHADVVPNDPQFPSLWGMQNLGQTGGTPGADIRAVNAWDVFTGSSAVMIAIIDTGVDYNHPDLAPNVFVNSGEIAGNGFDDDGNGFVDDVRGWDFVNNDNDPMDDIGHGTHVSGTCGAVGDDGIGVVGVNWQVRLLPIKFLGGFGGTTEDAIRSIDYAVLMRANIINASWGGGGFSEALRQAILRADSAGIVFAAAAGNDGVNNDFFPHYPSSFDCPNIVAVAATDHNDLLAYFSNYGVTSVDLGAPGVDVLSSLPGASYGTYSGTSMATPHVAGALGLIYGRHPGIGAVAAKNLLLNFVDELPSLSGRVLTGGRLNAFLPIAEADSIPPGAITDLEVTLVEGSRLELTWTATGDDGGVGRASRYEARYSTTPITEDNFSAATPVANPPAPLPAGSSQTLEVRGLGFSTPYYVALRARDEFDNPGPISNVASATTLGPPNASVAPGSLSADLLTGATASRVLTLTNTGASELLFEAKTTNPVGAALKVDLITGDDPSSGNVVATGRPVPIGKLGPGRPFPIQLPVGAEFDRPAGELVPKTSAPGLRVLGPTEEVFGSPQNQFFAGPRTRGNIFACTKSRTLREHRFYLQPSAPTQLWFLVYEGLTQIGNYQLVSASNASPSGTQLGWYSSGPVDVELVAGRFYVIVASFELESMYFNQQFIAPYPIPASFGSLIAGAGWTWGPPTTFPPPTFQEVPPQAFGDAVAYYQTLITGDAVTWLSLQPDSGRVAAGTSLDLAVTFDATGLNGGDYDGNVQIASNDPDRPELLVPAHLHVTGAPDISLSRPSIDYGPVFIGGARPETLVVSNPGTDLLTVSGLSSSPGEYTVDLAAPFSLGPGDSRVAVVTFRPTTVGLITGSVTVTSDDPDEPVVTVNLSGAGVTPPDIAVAPASMDVSLLSSETTQRTLTITNTGPTALEWSLSIRGPSASPASIPTLTRREVLGTVSPTAALNVKVTQTVEAIRATYGTAAGTNILLYTDDFSRSPGMQLGDLALQKLGLPYTAIYYDPIAFGTALTSQSWDLVVVDHASFYAVGDYWGAIESHLAGGGRVLISTFDIDGSNSPPTTLWSTIGLVPRGDVQFATPIYWWDPAHQLFNHPESVPQMTSMLDLYFDDGDRVDPLPGRAAPAGFVPVRTGQQASIVVSSNRAAIVNSFVPSENPWDLDGDGMSDAAELLENEIDFLLNSWLATDPAIGTVPPSSSVDVAVTFDATRLDGGDYYSDLVVTSNDPDEAEVAVPAHLHVTGVPDIAVAPTGLEFGSLFIGLTRTDTVKVSNPGHDQLVVTGIDVSDADYTASDAGGFTLAPRHERILTVSFHPSTAGPQPATMTIHSNDPDQPDVVVSLAGIGLIPPDIGVAPASLSADLLTGQQVTRTLTVSNTGGSDLTFTAAAAGATLSPLQSQPVTLGKGDHDPRHGDPVQDGQGGPDAFGYRWIDSDEPGGPTFDWVEISAVGTAVPIAGDDWNSGPIPIGFDFRFYGENYNSFQICSNGWISFTSFSTQFSTYPLPSPYAPENLLAAFWADLSTNPATVFFHNDGSRLIVEYRNVTYLGGGTPFTFEILLYPNGRIVYQYLDMGGTQYYAAVGIQNATRVDGLTIAFNTPYVHDGLAIQIAAVPPWLSVTPAAGTVPAGGHLDLEVRIDAASLNGGDYDGNVEIASNDPDEAQVLVPSHLHVTGAPDIALSRTAIDYGPVFLGVARAETLAVRNLGTDLLTVSGLTSSRGEYTLDLSAPFSLSPGASRVAIVTFQPAAAGPAPGTLTVASDDPDEAELVVTLAGSGVIPPDIGVSPESLEVNLLSGQAAQRTVTISNTGPTPLAWNLSIRGSSGASPATIHALTSRQVLGTVSPALPANLQGPREAVEAVRATYGIDSTANILLYSDDFLRPTGTHMADRALQKLGLPYIAIYYDPGGFVYLLGSRPWDLVIVDHSSLYGMNWQAVEAYVASGGRALISTFDVDGSSGPATSLWSTIGLTPSGDVLSATPIYAWDPAHHLFNGVESVPSISIMADFYFDDGDRVEPFPDRDAPAGFVPARASGQAAIVVSSDRAAIVNSFLPAENFSDLDNDGTLDAVELIENEVDFLLNAWLTADPLSGTVPPTSSADVTVTFDATDLAGGNYFSDLVITSNDPDEARVVVPARLHVTTVPDIAVAPTSLDFGSLFIGLARVDTFKVSNQGREPLVVSGIDVSSPDYEISAAGGFTLAPHEERVVAVRFHPSAEGDRSGTLTIHSDDPDESEVIVSLAGVGLIPPDIAVAPGSLALSLGPGVRITRTVTVSNTGGSDLTFSAGVANATPGPLQTQPVTFAKGEIDPRQGEPVPAGAGGPDAFGYRWVDSHEPGGPSFDWVEIAGIGTSVPVGGDEWTYGPVPIGFSFPFYGHDFTSVRICSNGFLSFTSTSKQHVNFPLPSPLAPENLLALFWSDLYSDTGSVFYHHDGTRLIVEYRNVRYFSGSTPFTFEVLLYPSGRIVYQYLYMGPATQTFGTIGIQNPTRSDGLTVAFNSAYVHSGLAIQIEAVPTWLALTPATGTIPAGGHQDLQVRFDASQLAIGNYAGSLRIGSNDPDEPLAAVPVGLRVLDGALLLVDPPALTFLDTYVGYSRRQTITLTSVGRDPLEVVDLTASLPDYHVEPAPPFVLAPEESVELELVFAPAAAGARSAELVIASNAVETPPALGLAGVGVVPPVAGVSPASLLGSVTPGGQIHQTVQLCNSGGSPLTFQARLGSAASPAARGAPAVGGTRPAGGAQPAAHDPLPRDPVDGTVAATVSWGLVTPDTGTVQAQSCADLDVLLDATGLAEGNYLTHLYVLSNDPAHPTIDVPVEFRVRSQVAIELSFDPSHLQLGGTHGGMWASAFLEPTPPLTPQDIDVGSILLNGSVAVDPSAARVIGDHDLDGRPDLGVKFRRAALALVLPEGDQVLVHVTGRIGAGQSFTADDIIEVRQGHIVQPGPHEVVPLGLPYNVLYDASTSERTMPVVLLVWFGHGGTWRIDATGLPNTGSIAWTVPAQPADSVRIAVVQMAEGQPARLENMIGVLGISDYFSIQGTLAVSNLPAATQLLPISPNPSFGPTLLRFGLTGASVASLEVFDLQGRQVRALELGHRGPGWHEVTWDGRDRSGAQVGAGLYFVRLRTTFGEWTQRMVRTGR